MYKKLLVPLDGSTFAENALEHVKSVAQSGTLEKIILIRVLEPLITDVRDYIGAEHAREAEYKLEADAKKYLDKKAADLRKNGILVEARLVVDGEPAAKILETAKAENIDLIVMSTHGRSAFFHWVFGSVAHKVLVNSSIPILVVPRKNKGGSL
jgi:nucleotide-binding universal stress UspA family protein